MSGGWVKKSSVEPPGVYLGDEIRHITKKFLLRGLFISGPCFIFHNFLPIDNLIHKAITSSKEIFLVFMFQH